MKQKLALWCALLIIAVSNAFGTPLPSSLYLINTQLPKAITQAIHEKAVRGKKHSFLAGLSGYYRGYKIDLHEGWGLLPEVNCTNVCDYSFDADCNQYDNVFDYHLLIANKVEPVFGSESNAVLYWKHNPKEPCMWYHMALTIHPGNDETEPDYSWDINRYEQEEIPTRLPENTLIILLNPEMIAYVADKNHSHTPGIITLPTIVFRSSTKQETWAHELDESSLCAMDLEALHSKKSPLAASIKRAAVFLHQMEDQRD